MYTSSVLFERAFQSDLSAGFYKRLTSNDGAVKRLDCNGSTSESGKHNEKNN
ncbi:MAG TPA: hypothetical protein VFH31_14835 [Pyrinomonadaceae bacterium]|nr:hypothetical protein [Pyrinomonadaceae bacterium]